jgi:uncharacterized membrane protein
MIFITPIWVTILLLMAIVNLIQDALAVLPPSVHPRTHISFFGIEFILGLFLILFIGLLVSNINKDYF